MVNKTDKYFWIANGLLVISLLVFFSPALLTNKIQAPGDFQTYPFFVSSSVAKESRVHLLYDPIVQFIPWFHFDKQMLSAGRLPLWNPYQGCGVPHIGNMQSSVFFPLNVFVYLLNWKWGFFFLYFFKLYLVGLFLYFYLKEIDIFPPIAILFSIAGIYLSFNLTVLYDAFSNAAYFFPLALWAIELILNHPQQFKGYLLFCLGFAIAVFGGNPELVFYGTFILALYLFIRLYQVYSWDLRHSWLPVLSKILVIFIIGILIASIQVLPFLEYFRLSSAYISRSLLGLNIRSLPIYILLFSILPPLALHNMNLLTSHIFNQYEAIPIIYPGVSIILFGIAGIIALHKDKLVKTFVFILIVSFCVGLNVPIIHGIIMHIQGFSVGRNYYLTIFIAWSMLIISSKTLDSFIAEQINFKSLKIAAVLILFLIIILGLFFIKNTYPSMPHHLRTEANYFLFLTTMLVIIVILLTLLIFHIKNERWLLIALGIIIYTQTAILMISSPPVVKEKYFFPKNEVFSLLKEQHGHPFRVTAFIGNNLPIAYATNINTFYNIEDIRNYDSLGVNWYNSIFQYLRLSDALNLTNVKYLIEAKDFQLSVLTNNLQPIKEYNGYTLYKNLSAFQRAFMLYHYLIADSDQQALDLLNAYSGQLNKTAIVFHKDIQGMPMTTNTQGTYTIAFTKYTPGYIKMSCNTSQPGLFFISDTYFPGWHARVDGKSTKIIRADYAFQGLWLTQGTHTIELNYAPASFKYGVLLTIIGILSLIGFYFIAFRKRKSNIVK